MASMPLLQPLELTASGRPSLLEDQDEVEVVVQDKVAVYLNNESQPTYNNGVCTLTTHRLLWYIASESRGFAVELGAVIGLQWATKGFTSSAKITLELGQVVPAAEKTEAFFRVRQLVPLNVPEDVVATSLASANGNADAALGSLFDQDLASRSYPRTGQLRLSFRGSGHSTFLAAVHQTLESRPWLSKALYHFEKLAQQQRAREFDPSRAGLGGLMKSLEQNKKQTQETLDVAFADLKGLMQKAADMVTLAEKFSQKIAKEGAEDAETSEFRSYLVSMGISSPVTKQSAGSAYHEQLSRQLTEFFIGLAKHKGVAVMTIPDLYCLFNRARGTELISPEDLMRAVSLFATLNLPCGLATFRGGLQYVHTKDYSEQEVALRLLRLARSRPAKPITEMDASKHLRLSVIMSRELLLVAETKGYLCRDEMGYSTSFYENYFLSEQLPAT